MEIEQFISTLESMDAGVIKRLPDKLGWFEAFKNVEKQRLLKNITEADRTTIGNPNPDFTWGFTNNFSYKNLDLSIFLQGSQGGDIFNLTNVQLTNGDANTTRAYYNSAWTPTNTDTNAPRVGNNSNREISKPINLYKLFWLRS